MYVVLLFYSMVCFIELVILESLDVQNLNVV